MYAREQYLNKVSHPKWTGGQSQIADILTKALDDQLPLFPRCSNWTLWSLLLTVSGCSSPPTSVYLSAVQGCFLPPTLVYSFELSAQLLP